MKKTLLYYILFGITMVFLFSSILQSTFHIFKFHPLYGVEENSVTFPELTYKSYKDNSFQIKSEKYISRNFGFREPVMRYYNQLIWDLFHKSYVKQVSIGKNNWLYEPWYVKEYYCGSNSDKQLDSINVLKENYDAEILRTYQLQNILKEYGIHLFVCMIPGKPYIYPEYLPPDTYHKEMGIQSIDYFSKGFDKYGVNYIDFTDFFLKMKDTAIFNVFPQTGTHWSNIAALYAADSIINYMEYLSGKKIADIKIGNLYRSETKSPDADMENLLNLRRSIQTEQNYYADVTVEITADTLPRLLTIGDSYFWNICNQLHFSHIFSEYPYWYYNYTIYFDKKYSNVKEVNMTDELIKSDYIMLMYSSNPLYYYSSGFSAQALASICIDTDTDTIPAVQNTDGIITALKLKQQLKATTGLVAKTYRQNDMTIQDSHEVRVEKIIVNMKKDAQWIELLKEKADKKGVSLEQVMKEDAEWIIKKQDSKKH